MFSACDSSGSRLCLDLTRLALLAELRFRTLSTSSYNQGSGLCDDVQFEVNLPKLQIRARGFSNRNLSHFGTTTAAQV